MKTLPVLREKKRYIAFRIISENAVNRKELSDELFYSIGSLFGDIGASEINPSLISFDRKYGILRCSRDRTQDARAALACINRIKGGNVSVMVLGISGTIRGAMEKFIQPGDFQFDQNEMDISPDSPLRVKNENRSDREYADSTFLKSRR